MENLRPLLYARLHIALEFDTFQKYKPTFEVVYYVLVSAIKYHIPRSRTDYKFRHSLEFYKMRAVLNRLLMLSCLFSTTKPTFIEHWQKKAKSDFRRAYPKICYAVTFQRYFLNIVSSIANFKGTCRTDLQLRIQAIFHVYMFHSNSSQKSSYWPKTNFHLVQSKNEKRRARCGACQSSTISRPGQEEGANAETNNQSRQSTWSQNTGRMAK